MDVLDGIFGRFKKIEKRLENLELQEKRKFSNLYLPDSGILLWGSDTNLKRLSANILATDDEFSALRLLLTEASVPGTPASGFGVVYVGTDGVIYAKNDAGLITRMVEYTPPTAHTVTWTADTVNPAIGNGTLSGRYTVLGKRCFYDLNMTAGTTTTFGTGLWSFSIPITAKSAGHAYVGVAHVRDAGTNNYERLCEILAGASVLTYFMRPDDGVNYNNLSSTYPFTWGNGDSIYVTINYEID